jgi:hypothetical protein
MNTKQAHDLQPGDKLLYEYLDGTTHIVTVVNAHKANEDDRYFADSTVGDPDVFWRVNTDDEEISIYRWDEEVQLADN